MACCIRFNDFLNITFRIHPGTYAALGVPELWRRNQNQLQFNRLIDGHYQEVPESPTFPGLPLQDLLPQYITQSRIQGRNQQDLASYRQRKTIGGIRTTLKLSKVRDIP